MQASLFRRSRSNLEEHTQCGPGDESAHANEQRKLDGPLREFVAGSGQTNQEGDPHDDSWAIKGGLRGGSHIVVLFRLLAWHRRKEKPVPGRNRVKNFTDMLDTVYENQPPGCQGETVMEQ